MKRIQIDIADYQLSAWKAYCKQEQKTGARILRNFIHDCVQNSSQNNFYNLPNSQSSDFLKRQKKQISLRLNEHELSVLQEKSNSLGYSHPNHWIRQILEKTLFEREIYHPLEISALQKATSQLWGIGHNLNQITKAIHINFQNHHQLNLNFLQKLEISITDVIQKIDNFCLKNHRM